MLKKVVGYTALGYLAIIIAGLTLCCVFFNPRLGAAWGFGILFFAIPAIPLGLFFGMIISAVAQRAAREKMESRASILSDQVRHQYNNDYRAWLQHVSRERFDMEIEGSKEYDWVQQQRQNADDSVKKYQNAH